MVAKVGMGNRVRLAAVLIAVTCVLRGSSADLDQARKYYDLTEFEESLKVLHGILQRDAAVYELLGRNYFMLGEYKKASDALEKAVAAEPRNSDYALWLGRAYGRRAETSNPFSAMGHASKARQYFERSVELNPKNIEALNDLLEYYLEAPGFMGGGMEKAKATVARISQADAGEGQWAQSKLDEKHKEMASAEEHLRRALELNPQKAGRFIDLARFLAKQGRFQESDQNFAHAERIAPDSPKLLYERADVYIKSGRNLDVARNLLKQYLSARITPEDPPKAEARKLLRQIEGG
jgi:cytochrome c-type biogenesis protein CcmH/NrfG